MTITTVVLLAAWAVTLGCWVGTLTHLRRATHARGAQLDISSELLRENSRLRAHRASAQPT